MSLYGKGLFYFFFYFFFIFVYLEKIYGEVGILLGKILLE